MNKNIRKLLYLQPKRGGRLDNIMTFCDACEQKTYASNASWNLESTIQSADEAADEFTHVGLTNLLDKKVVVKLMMNGIGARQEKHVQQLFSKKPHINIVQPICTFECNESPIRWQHHVIVPQQFCSGGPSKFVVIIQEFIQGGNLRTFNGWNDDIWKSIILQLTYSCMEWYESYKFIYDDWHLGNILLDSFEPTKNLTKYKAFGRTWKVHHSETTDSYIRPVLTDFARSSTTSTMKSKHFEPFHLGNEISLVWDMLRHSTQNKKYVDAIDTYCIPIGEKETIADIIHDVKAFVKCIN